MNYSSLASLTSKLSQKSALKHSLEKADNINTELTQREEEFKTREKKWEEEKKHHAAAMATLRGDKDFCSEEEYERKRKEMKEVNELTRALKAALMDDEDEAGEKDRDHLDKPN